MYIILRRKLSSSSLILRGSILKSADSEAYMSFQSISSNDGQPTQAPTAFVTVCAAVGSEQAPPLHFLSFMCISVYVLKTKRNDVGSHSIISSKNMFWGDRRSSFNSTVYVIIKPYV